MRCSNFAAGSFIVAGVAQVSSSAFWLIINRAPSSASTAYLFG